MSIEDWHLIYMLFGFVVGGVFGLGVTLVWINGGKNEHT